MLETLGVQEAEENVYRALLGLPRSTVAELAARVGREVSSVRRSLASLEQMGLVSRIAGRPVRLLAARPDVAVDVLVARRQEELGRAQLAARELLAEVATEERHRPEQVVEVIVGRQAIATRFEQLLTSTRNELMVFDRPPYVADANRSDTTVRQLMRSQVQVRGLYAPESLAMPGALDEAQDAARFGELSRVHPDLPMKLAIGDRSLAILPLAVQEVVDVALAIHPSALLDALVQLFDLLWQQATPLLPPDTLSSDVDAELVALLAAGVKDDAIARRLDISTRTLSRRVAELMDELNVRTRFQAGIQAARLGWFSAQD
ncbi:helix-turn-helix domain-containing protein [Luteipulveratus mongoliensis]|uniref:Transcriptional regulator TrmB n=1 Tax=Luteipulveratus mongoliensis TaxID=571913 RepID=A0A0K1JDE4_9MICO|nr:helix-turn-helix domain-containing protein [Luteipulveratus mongoliensis]AKU14716.1 transcriptional regulator TrmB [Luteipulveratus mongoliensis]